MDIFRVVWFVICVKVCGVVVMVVLVIRVVVRCFIVILWFGEGCDLF